MPTIAPIINSPRLTLRPQRYGDFEQLVALYASERSRYIGGPLGRSQVWLNFMNSVGHWPIMGMGGWSIELTATGQCVGEVAVCQPPDYPETELGWALFGGYEGQGYAVEAASAARDFARSTLRVKSLVSYIDPDNSASINLSRRLDAVRDANAATPNGDPCLVFRYW